MLRALGAVMLIGVSSVCAQNLRPLIADGSMTILPAITLKDYLALNDSQVDALRDIAKSRRDAEQAIHDRIAEKQRELMALHESNSTDAARIGQLVIDIRELRRQLPFSAEPYRSQALAVLTAEQKTKLPKLEEALLLDTPAYEAVSLNLIEDPQNRQYIGLPRTLPAVEPSTSLPSPATLKRSNFQP